METRHIRLDYDEAVDSKKKLLSTEINLLQVVKKIRAYKIVRKKELSYKNGLRIKMKALNKKINSIYSSFPEEYMPKKKRVKKKVKETEMPKDIHDELEEIKRKLEKLS
jgi:hypothetical protein